MGMAGPGGGTGQEQARSAEEAREYARRMRSLPVDEVIREVLFGLLNAALYAGVRVMLRKRLQRPD